MTTLTDRESRTGSTPTRVATEPPVEFRTKTAVVYEQLRRWIVSGTLAPGQRLDQGWLAAELRVSRMPLRQALLRLEADGLIENEPHRSAVVAPLSLPELTDVYAARTALETMLAAAGALHATETDHEAMAEALATQREAVGTGDLARFVEADRVFHFTLYRASGYARSVEMTGRLRDLADRYIWHYARYRSGAARSVNEHEAIFAACQQRDSDGVRRLTADHVHHGLAVLSDLVSER